MDEKDLENQNGEEQINESPKQINEQAGNAESDAIKNESIPTTPVDAGNEQEEVPAITEHVDNKDDITSEDTSAEQSVKANVTESEEKVLEEVDYSAFSYEALLEAITSLEKGANMQQIDKALKSIGNRFYELTDHDRNEAFTKFIEDGGEKDGFDYHLPEAPAKVEEKLKKLKELSSQYHKDFEKRKEDNLKQKEDLLEQLRALIDSDETTKSIDEIKSIQEKWKTVGPIASIHNKTIWANYNALLDRYYDKRSIYFELKELDRKKNFDAKKALCEKAEGLLEIKDIREAVQKLNELHEEYKHVGPVPRDEQEALWSRFKAASDEVYKRRKEYQDVQKEEFKANLVQKLALLEEMTPFTAFDSSSIKEWNQKTKELLEIQKKWESVGLMPKENAKEVNKKFWTAFKLFFSNKSRFFKRLEGLRKENLEKKEALVLRAEELKENEDFKGTAEKYKKLQREWKEIGPVPEKVKDDVYKRFKAACDHFFDKRREQGKEAEKEYVENLKQKQAICLQLTQVTAEEGVDKILALQDEYAKIGFVPRNDIKSAQESFDKAIDAALAAVTVNMTEEEKELASDKVQVNMLSNSPMAQRKVERKQISMRKKITQLENDISTWNNNLAFFANSKNADKLKKDFESKIQSSENELNRLKKQLRLLNTVK